MKNVNDNAQRVKGNDPAPGRVISVDFTNVPSRGRSKASGTPFEKEIDDSGLVLNVVKSSDGYVADMPRDVLDGKLGELCEKRMGNFPLAYAWPSVVTIASALVARGQSPIPPNLFTALVGVLHSGKSVCIDQSGFLLNSQEAGAVAEIKSGSAEGLLKAIGNRGTPVVLLPDELAHLLTKSQLENASFPMILSSLFYKESQTLVIAHGKVIDFRACLSILGGVVEERFEDSFGAGSVGGLYDRFLFGQLPSNYRFRYRPQEGKPEFNWPPEKTRPVMPTFHGDVWELRDQWLKDKIPDRVAEISLRVAAICAAFDGRRELRAKDLDPAFELACYQDSVRRRLAPNAGQNQDAKIENKIVRYLLRCEEGFGKGKPVNKRIMIRRTHISEDYGSPAVERVIHAMETIGTVGTKSIETKGRPKIEIFLLDRPEEQ